MTILDKAIRKWGFEDPRTITIAVLEEEEKTNLAEALYNTLIEDEE